MGSRWAGPPPRTATTLALGIAIDAPIVRGLLAPALVGVLGKANLTMPRWLGRVLFLPH